MGGHFERDIVLTRAIFTDAHTYKPWRESSYSIHVGVMTLNFPFTGKMIVIHGNRCVWRNIMQTIVTSCEENEDKTRIF